MKTLPISVVVPALNAELFIAEAIASVQVQTLSVSEIIVVDNGCVDRTVEIANKHGAQVVQRRDRPGVSRARNEGIRACNQEWVALLDADDRWHPQKIEHQWVAIKACPDAGIISCRGMVFESAAVLEDSPESLERTWDGYEGRVRISDHVSYFPKIENDFFPRFQPSPSDVLLRRDVFSTVGLFDEEILYCEDFEFFLRVFAQYPLAVVEKVLVQHRRHDGKRSFHLPEIRNGLFSVVNKMLKHRDKYPAGAPEVYRDLLKKHFLRAEQALIEHRQ